MRATDRFTRRLTIAGGLAAAAAAPLVAAVLIAPASNLGQTCSNGEEGDAFTGQCVPFVVPNSPGGNAPAAAPAGNATACPAGVSGSECAIQPPANSGPNMPANPPPQQPEQELADVVTPGY